MLFCISARNQNAHAVRGLPIDERRVFMYDDEKDIYRPERKGAGRKEAAVLLPLPEACKQEKMKWKNRFTI